MSADALKTGSKSQDRKRRLTPEQLADLKSKSRCNRCHQLVHWASDHNKCALATEAAKEDNHPTKQFPKTGKKPNVSASRTVQFHMATIDDDQSCLDVPGPLVDDAAPYSAMGIADFKALSKYILPSWNGNWTHYHHQSRMEANGNMDLESMLVQNGIFLVPLCFLRRLIKMCPSTYATLS